MKILGTQLPFGFATSMCDAMPVGFTRPELLAGVRTRLRRLELNDDYSYGLLVLAGERTREAIEEAVTTAILHRERKAGRIAHTDGTWHPVHIEA